MSRDDGVIIRPARPEDLIVVEAIEKASFVDPWPRTALMQELRTDRLRRPLVAERCGRPVGYLMGWLVADELHIINLAVDREERSGGIGSQLLGRACSDAADAGCRLATLEVRSGNTVARDFYLNRGFLVSGNRKNYYAAPREDAVIMIRDLKAGYRS